ncbi:MAG: hypothetical protein ABIY70_04110 [Capsulimonas sp.]|uniref:hypothetical protein n=1 Tax=Capsulimonas sp. TaxID=2494211 RepID=UPI003263EA6D
MANVIPIHQGNHGAGRFRNILLIGGAAVMGLGAMAPAFMGAPLAGRGVLAAVLMLLLIVLVRMSPSVGLNATLIYLVLMGWMRRAMTPYVDWVDMDPLLVVAPGVALVYGGAALWNTRGKSLTKYTKHLLALLVVMVLEIFNPIQGGISVGIFGALFYIVPILWFFVGRDMLDVNRLGSLLRTFQWVAVAALVYGSYQMWFGFSQPELDWAEMAHFSWITAPGLARPFSTLPSFAEYAHLVMGGAVIVTAGLLCRQKIGLILIPVMLYGLFMASSRSAMMALLATMCVLWAVMSKDRKTWIFRGWIAAIVAVIALVAVMTRVQESTVNSESFETSKTSKLVTHQTEGFLNPTDPSKSTLGVHTSMVLIDLARGFETPIGYGLGATTLASVKMGNETNNSEIDISNMFTALGAIGGVLYLAFVIRSLILAFKTWHRTRNIVWLSVLGVLICYLFLWLIGGEYTISMIVWLCLGALERAQRKVITI